MTALLSGKDLQAWADLAHSAGYFAIDRENATKLADTALLLANLLHKVANACEVGGRVFFETPWDPDCDCARCAALREYREWLLTGGPQAEDQPEVGQ